MRTEIGGTFKWSAEQIEAYARAFREGDAVKVDGKWAEVKRYENTHAISIVSTPTPEANPYNLNYAPDGENRYKGTAKGFLRSRVKSPFEIITPKDYKVQEGDKLVWFGETQEYYGRSELTFGKVYDVRKDGDRLIYKTDDTLSILARSEKDRWKFWGVIPRYENVKEEEEMNGKDECVGKFKKGDRVRVTGGNYEGWEGSVGQSDEVGGELSCAVLFDDHRGYRRVEEEVLELVEKAEKSPEQEAFEYLLTLDKTLVKIFLTDEINDWAKEFLKQKDYDSAKQATEILEKLEKGE